MDNLTVSLQKFKKQPNTLEIKEVDADIQGAMWKQFLIEPFFASFNTKIKTKYCL